MTTDIFNALATGVASLNRAGATIRFFPQIAVEPNVDENGRSATDANANEIDASISERAAELFGSAWERVGTLLKTSSEQAARQTKREIRQDER